MSRFNKYHNRGDIPSKANIFRMDQVTTNSLSSRVKQISDFFNIGYRKNSNQVTTNSLVTFSAQNQIFIKQTKIEL